MVSSHPSDCPDWEYKNHKNCDSHLTRETTKSLKKLRKEEITVVDLAKDSRATHLELFKALTPTSCPYYAGHYRGEDFRCLRYAPVFIPGDSMVGCQPDQTDDLVNRFGTESTAAVRLLDARLSVLSTLTEDQKLQYLVAISSEFFVLFLKIHPYLNGNGHIARFILWSFLGRFGYWPKHWSVHPRPKIAGYVQYIREFRRGNKQTLMMSILNDLQDS